MEQNTEEWLRLRHTKIGASDANIIMGVSEYMNREELLLHKNTPFDKLPPRKSNPVADMGHVVEELERPRFEFLQNKKFMPTVIIHPEIGWIMASFDGLSMDETESWESKLVGKDVFQYCVETGFCPEKFWPQIQHQFLANPKMKKTTLGLVKFEKKMFDGVKPENFQRHQIELVRDDGYIETKLMPALMKFREDLIKETDFTDLERLAERSSKLKEEIELLQIQKDVLDKQIQEQVKPLGRVVTSNWAFSYTEQKGRVTYDTKKIFEDYKVDLEKYKKEGKPFYKYSVKSKGE